MKSFNHCISFLSFNHFDTHFITLTYYLMMDSNYFDRLLMMDSNIFDRLNVQPLDFSLYNHTFDKYKYTIKNLMLNNFDILSNSKFDFDMFIKKYDNADVIEKVKILLTFLQNQILHIKNHNRYTFCRNIFCINSAFLAFCYLSLWFSKRSSFNNTMIKYLEKIKQISVGVFSFTGFCMLSFQFLSSIYDSKSILYFNGPKL